MIDKETKRRVINFPEQHMVETGHARKLAKELGSWVTVDRIFGEVDEIGIDCRFIRLVDDEYGILDIFPSKGEEDFIYVNFTIYNPTKGPETLKTVIDVCKAIANKLNLLVIYEAHPIHKRIRTLLLENGLSGSGDTLVLKFPSNSQPNEEYFKLAEMINKLLNLRLVNNT